MIEINFQQNFYHYKVKSQLNDKNMSFLGCELYLSLPDFHTSALKWGY